MRLVAALAPAVVLTVSLAGCFGEEPTSGDAPDRDGSDVAAAPGGEGWPSGDAARGYIESYVMAHPYRSPRPEFATFMDAARADLATLLDEMGLDVRMHAYNGSPPGVNVLAFQNGTERPDEWVVLSAHYDTIDAGVGTTIFGAWDDGAGVGALLELAHAMSAWQLPITVVYAFFDGEEKGLDGSAAFVEEIALGEGTHEVVANINMDPPGLNWPCGDASGAFPVKIIHEMSEVDGGEQHFVALYDAIEQGLAAAEVPDEVRDYTPGIPIADVGGVGLRGSSDHASFGEAGIANVFVGGVPFVIVNGDPNEHTAAALTYPLHTPLDTLQAMDARCVVGSLAEGLQVTVDIVATAVLALAVASP